MRSSVFPKAKVFLIIFFISIGSAFGSPQWGITAGVSSSNVQVPERIYRQASAMFGVEAVFAQSETFALGPFWEGNMLTAVSGRPAPFQTGGDESGWSHFGGLLIRVSPSLDSKLFIDLKAGINGRSVGAPPPSSDLAPGLGAAIGWRWFEAEQFSLSPRLAYRVLSYSVNGAAHYAHQGYDVNVLMQLKF